MSFTTAKPLSNTILGTLHTTVGTRRKRRSFGEELDKVLDVFYFLIFTYDKIYLTVLRFKFTQDLHLTIV